MFKTKSYCVAGRKKTFPCGHKGKGQYCHRCEQNEVAKKVRQKKEDMWNERLRLSPVEITHLPRKVAEKVMNVIDGLLDGRSYHEFNGKRLVTMGQREVIRIPIGWNYRLICRANSGGMEFVEVITHEEYHNRLSSGGWRT